MTKKFDLNEQIAEVMAIAEKNGVAENFFFVTTFNDYKRMRIILAKLGKNIDTEGTLVQGKVNPCIAEYSKTAQSAARLAGELMKMVSGGGDAQPISADKKRCPDFEHMDAKTLRKWCKKFDIDPNDYAASFLYKALRKRWEFECGE